jgi:hypothetical protein
MRQLALAAALRRHPASTRHRKHQCGHHDDGHDNDYNN